MATPVNRGNIREFVQLAAEAFGTDQRSAEAATRTMLVRLLEAGRPSAKALLDCVPGARDLVFAGWLPSPAGSEAAGPRETPVPADLQALFLAYCYAHAGCGPGMPA